MADVLKSDIKTALSALGISTGDIVLVHSSMKSFGHVLGGADTVIDAFLETVGETGTVVMPTLSQKNWETVYEDWHMDRPSDVGLLTETFRKRENALRSNQATHSVAAIGAKAEWLTKEHTAFGPRIGPFGDYAFSKSSPWQKMSDLDAKIVFIGVPMLYNTMKHLVEYQMFNEALDLLAPADREEMERKLQHYGQPAHDQWVWTYLDAMALQKRYDEKGLLSHTVCGNAELIAISAKECVEYTRQLLVSEAETWWGEKAFAWFHEAEQRCEKAKQA